MRDEAAHEWGTQTSEFMGGPPARMPDLRIEIWGARPDSKDDSNSPSRWWFFSEGSFLCFCCRGSRTVRAFARMPTSQNRDMEHAIWWRGLDVGHPPVDLLAPLFLHPVSRAEDRDTKKSQIDASRLGNWR
jgi:hypothetical protein